jgi:hypothetical protein
MIDANSKHEKRRSCIFFELDPMVSLPVAELDQNPYSAFIRGQNTSGKTLQLSNLVNNSMETAHVLL